MKLLNRLVRVLVPRVLRACPVVVGLAAVHLASDHAWAQKSARLPGDGEGFLPWAVGGGIIVVICIAGFLNPKRSHLG
jgi:hypothetical protein